tara:strand:+ start:330 stop:725 length:396 start_codon:yes stop_codon:yes gene_type:complete
MDDEIDSLLCFCQQWNPNIHGIEEDDTPYVNLLKTKMLVLNCNIVGENNHEYIDEIIDIMNDSDNPELSVSICRIMIAKKYYLYRNRVFILENKGISLFQKLWKKYHNEYILPRKQLKNIFKREIYGKYII